jgi:DnaJ-class molecular chaperone
VEGGLITFLLVTLVIVGYIASLWISPWVKCSRCNGQPRRKGLIFSYAFRPCSKCNGTGRRARFGRRLIFGPPRWFN